MLSLKTNIENNQEQNQQKFNEINLHMNEMNSKFENVNHRIEQMQKLESK